MSSVVNYLLIIYWLCRYSLGPIRFLVPRNKTVNILKNRVRHHRFLSNRKDLHFVYQKCRIHLSWLSNYVVRVMVFNATFNNISLQSVLLVEETRVLGENHRHVANHWQLYHIMLYQVHPTWARFELTTLVVIGTDCIGSYKSNYYTITATTARPIMKWLDEFWIWHFQ
jgi:hypothetical protein